MCIKTLTFIKALIIITLTVLVAPANANFNKAQLAFQEKNYSQAKLLFEKQLKKNEKNVVAHLYLAKIGVKNEHLDFAEKHIVKAQEYSQDKQKEALDNTTQAEVFHWLGTIMEKQAEKASVFSMSGYAKESLNGYLTSIELLPTNLQYRAGLINFYLGAPSLFGGDIDKAIQHAKITFEQDENFGYKMLVNCYAEQGDRQLVLTTYQQAIKKFPLDAELLFMRGSYWKGERKYDKAVSDYQLALTLQAEGNEQKAAQLLSWYWIGRISGFNGKHLTRGINAYQQVIDFNTDIADIFVPNKARTQFRMAKLMMLNKQTEQAKAIFIQLLNSNLTEDLKDEIRDELD